MDLKRVRHDTRAAARELIFAAREPTYLVWALYLLTVPVYLFKSGLPQPGDWLILPLVPLAFSHRVQRSRTLDLTVRALTAFTVYVTVLNLIWSAASGSWTLSSRYGFLMSPIFYVYNALMFVVVLRLYLRYRARFLWFTAKVILISLVVQVAFSAVVATPGLRVTVLFNNANQLGFYGLLSASLLFLFQRRKYLSTLEVTLGMVASVYLCLLSASKAALAGIALLALFGAMVKLRTMLLAGVVIAASLLVDSPISAAIDRTLERFRTDESHGTFEERGYDRIVNHPEYLVIGSGEGNYERFRETTVIGKHEIHSSIGTLAFCYGIAGVTIFGIFMWLVLRGSGLRTWLLVAPSFAYGMAHQGLRFTLFWVLLAIVAAMTVQHRRVQRPSSPITSATRAAAVPRS